MHAIHTHSSASDHPRVLVVNADEADRGMEESILREHGCETEGVDNTSTALMRALTENYDVLLARQHSRLLNGFSLIRKLRFLGCMVPVVMICGAIDASTLPIDLRDEISSVLSDTALADDLVLGIEGALNGASEDGEDSHHTFKP